MNRLCAERRRPVWLSSSEEAAAEAGCLGGLRVGEVAGVEEVLRADGFGKGLEVDVLVLFVVHA